MDILTDLFRLLLPWVIFTSFILIFAKLLKMAKQGNRSVIAFGFMVQIFLPNINVERRIDVLVKQEQEARKKNNESE